MKTKKQIKQAIELTEKKLDKEVEVTKENNYWRGFNHALRFASGDRNYDQIVERLREEK